MVKENKLVVESRNALGSASSRRLRRAGMIPGNINNNKGESSSIQLKGHEFEMLLRHQRSENILFDLVVGGAAPKKVLLREVQHDPMTGSVRHVDFLEVSMTTKMRVRIPIVLHGDPVGVLQEGGILEQIIRELEVECLPGDLIETIEADVSHLKLKENLRVRDLKISEKLVPLVGAEVVLALVSEPRAEEEEAKPEEAAAEGAEPEVITKGKEDGEEGEAEGEEGKKADKGAKKEGAAGGKEGAKPGADKGKPAAAEKGADKGKKDDKKK